MTKAAFFDIDGVLTKGFLIDDFWNHMVEKGIIRKEAGQKRKKLMQGYKNGQTPYVEFITKAPELIAAEINGMKHSKIKKEMKDFLHKRKINTFSYSKSLIKLFKDSGFRTIAVSGSDQDFIENYKRILDFDEVYGTKFTVKNGTYTGRIEINMGLKESKSTILNGFSNNGLKTSFGFGDTAQDAGILENVNIPIALNPTADLKKIASKKGWIIMRENDDVVGEVAKLINNGF